MTRGLPLLFSILLGAGWALPAAAAGPQGAAPPLSGEAPVALPAELAPLLPSGARVIAYRSVGAPDDKDIVLVTETPDAVSPPGMPTERRSLFVFRQQGGIPAEVLRNDKVIACSHCGQSLDDPFAARILQLTPGQLRIEQYHGGFHPSSAIYVFRQDVATKQWLLASARIGRSEEEDSGAWKQQFRTLHLPPTTTLADFDPGWRLPEYWNAIVANPQTHLLTSFFNKPGQRALEQDIHEECLAAGKCQVLVQQRYGCLAVAQDGAGRFFTASSLVPGAEQTTARHAEQQCASQGAGQCRVVAQGCSVGYE